MEKSEAKSSENILCTYKLSKIQVKLETVKMETRDRNQRCCSERFNVGSLRTQRCGKGRWKLLPVSN